MKLIIAALKAQKGAPEPGEAREASELSQVLELLGVTSGSDEEAVNVSHPRAGAEVVN